MPLPHTALLVYFVAYFLLAFLWRSLLVYRHTGINPFVLPTSDDAPGFVGRAFKAVMVVAGLVVLGLAFLPGVDRWLGAWHLPLPFQPGPLAWLGWGLLMASLLWLFVAQAQMGLSWRIGIDTLRRTELVQQGLFHVSRNPIFLAMRVNLLGFFFVYPSAATLALLTAGDILIQVQVRLEEQHLLTVHGATYARYREQVRRWL